MACRSCRRKRFTEKESNNVALKLQLDTLDGLDPKVQEHYVKNGEKYELAMQGEHPKVTEFRTNNVELLKENAALKTQMAEAPKPDTRVTELEAELATAKSTAAAVQAKADSLVLHSAVSQAFLGAGGKTDAVDFIVSEASKTFKVADGKIQTEEFGAPGEKLSIAAWILQQSQSHHSYFKPSTGGGAAPQKGSGSTAGDSRRVVRNPSAQTLGQLAGDIKANKVRLEYD
jgi:hypothetical protein